MEVREPIPAVYRLTFSDWLEMPEREGFVEILHGELLVTPSPTTRHQRIVGRLFRALQAHLEVEQRGEVFLAPLGVRFSDETVLEPDLVVVLAEHADRIRERHVEAPPDVVIEVLSPGTAGRDLQPKRAVYEAAGVTEYWIVDPHAGVIEVLTLRGGVYESFGRFGIGTTLESAVLPQLLLPVRDLLPG